MRVDAILNSTYFVVQQVVRNGRNQSTKNRKLTTNPQCIQLQLVVPLVVPTSPQQIEIVEFEL